MKASIRIASLVLALFLFIGITAPAARAAGGERKQGIAFVTASSLRLRSGASSATATIDYASKNEVVVVLGKTGQWYKVIYNLRTGYMHSDSSLTAHAPLASTPPMQILTTSSPFI